MTQSWQRSDSQAAVHVWDTGRMGTRKPLVKSGCDNLALRCLKYLPTYNILSLKILSTRHTCTCIHIDMRVCMYRYTHTHIYTFFIYTYLFFLQYISHTLADRKNKGQENCLSVMDLTWNSSLWVCPQFSALLWTPARISCLCSNPILCLSPATRICCFERAAYAHISFHCLAFSTFTIS